MNCIAPWLVDLKGRYFNLLKKNNPKEFKKYCKNFLPIERMCNVEELAQAVLFLCSKNSSYMPGSILKFDGVGN